MGREELASPSPLNWLLILHRFLLDSLPVLASVFLENDFSVSILSLTGGITLRSNSNPIIFVSIYVNFNLKVALEVRFPPLPFPSPHCLYRRYWDGLYGKSLASGFKLVYEEGRLLFSILASLLWKQQYLVLTSTLRDDSFINLFLVTSEYWI